MRLQRAKAVLFVLSCICCISLLSGCVKMTMGVTVDSDGGGTVAIRLGFNQEASAMLNDDGSGNSRLDNMMASAQAQGYEAERYEEDGYEGIYITQYFDSLAQMVGTDPYTNGLSFTSSKGSGKRTFALTGEPLVATDVKAAVQQIASTTEGAQILFEVHMPYEIIESNATNLSADKRTATWDLMQFEGEIKLTSVGWDRLFGFLPVWIAWLVLGVLALAAVVLVIAGCVKVARKKRVNRQDLRQPLPLQEHVCELPQDEQSGEESKNDTDAGLSDDDASESDPEPLK